ncbi:MAG: 1-acyl-sn-glycerol-3-phosphate acyltransferase [Planctomycetales bacterium]|nr:1-acyl-sn-glycerol-3-phosphate acyltransferase [bacterium]UNM09343.1 MAG: 1-acyl-sn-glycerol-3-phosphate acyltransferase [Planctomycetales bacterium]
MDQFEASQQEPPGGYKFIPPRHDPLMMGIARLITPLYLRIVTHVDRVEISEEHRAILKGKMGQRVILTPNHPSYEPPVVMQLGGMLGTGFYFLAAREIFDDPLQNFVCSRIGAYSINRGAKDDDSQHATRQLLRMGKRWLVIFPEGQEYYLHDIVLPFLPGAARFGYGALDDIRREGKQDPVWILPVTIRYHYRGNVDKLILGSLARLEKELALESSGGIFERVQRVTYCLLEVNERLYDVEVNDPENVDLRISRLRERVLMDVERKLGMLNVDLGSPLRNRLRKLFVAVSRMRRSANSRYERRLLDRRAKVMRAELQRVLEFVAMPGKYVQQDSSAERYLDLLGRFETEVFGKLKFFGPRTARVSVCEPVNLGDTYEQWKSDNEGQVEQMTEQIEELVRTRLDELCEEYRTEVRG